MKKGFLSSFYLVLLMLISLGQTQQCLNFISVNGRLLEGQAACYFINYGDSQNAFVNADIIARELGVLVTFDSERQVLLFSRGTDSVELQATTNITTGLVKRSGVMTVNGENVDSPMGIIAGGISYVAVTPIVAAFYGESIWDAPSQTILVYTARQTQASTRINETQATPSNTVTEQPKQQVIASSNAIYSVGEPRIGKHEGYTRVAIDLPAGTSYLVSVEGAKLIISLPSLKASNFIYTSDGPYIASINYELRNDVLALVINTRYALSAEGYGYRMGVVPASASKPSDVLYIDFSTSIYGQRPQAGVTSTPQAQEEASLPIPARAIIIDPGHGGGDPGAQGVVSEEEVVLDVALKLKALLERQGITVIMTRSGDYSLKDAKRADLAARAAMATRDRNLFISIHANAAHSSSANGIETWVFGEPVDASLLDIAINENGGGELGEALTLESQEMFESIVSDIVREEQLRLSMTLAEMVQAGMISETGARDRGIHENYFYVIRNAQTPAVLVELGFVSNAAEGEKLSTNAYRQKLADGLYQGIMNFFGQAKVLSNGN